MLPPSFKGSAVRFSYLIEVKALYEVLKSKIQVRRSPYMQYLHAPRYSPTYPLSKYTLLSHHLIVSH